MRYLAKGQTNLVYHPEDVNEQGTPYNQHYVNWQGHGIEDDITIRPCADDRWKPRLSKTYATIQE